MKPRRSSPWPKTSLTEVPRIKQSVIWHLGWDIPLWCINKQSERKPQGYIQKTHFIDHNVLHVSTSSQSPFSVCNVLRSLLFWDVMQRRLVVSYRRFRRNSPRVLLKRLLGPWRLDREVVRKRWWLSANIRCVTSQKSGDVIYIAAEAWSHAYNFLYTKCLFPLIFLCVCLMTVL